MSAKGHASSPVSRNLLVVSTKFRNAGITTANRLNGAGSDTTTRHACTDAFEQLAREETWINLVPRANAAPAHVVVVVSKALTGAHATLVVHQDAGEELGLRRGEGVGQ